MMNDQQTHQKISILPDNSEIEYFTASDGVRLRIGFFPAKGNAKANIFLLNGHREFMEKYGEFIGEFQSRAMNIYSLDLRGQGLSDRALHNRNKSHNLDFGRMVLDIDEIIKAKLDIANNKIPFYLITHSMGSQLGLRYLHDYVDIFDKAVLMAPFTEFNFKWPIIGVLARAYFKIVNALGFSQSFAPAQAKNMAMMDHDQFFKLLSHDRARYDKAFAAIEANPDLFLGGVTNGWIKAMDASLNIIGQAGYAENIKTPILCLLSEQEHVVDNKRTIRILKGTAKIEMIKGARHEIYFEKDEFRKILWTKIDDFLKDE